MNNQSSAPKNALQQGFTSLNNIASQPPDDIERISYGVIAEVHEESYQVKVNFLKADKTLGEAISDGFLPLLNSLSQIHLLYGALRPGLLVRIYWRGKIKPNTAIIEVIGDEDSSFLQKEIEVNEIETGPWMLLSGGLAV
jgi:hypothetical protein